MNQQSPVVSRDRSDVLRDSCYSFDRKCNSLALRKTQSIYIANSLHRLGEDALAAKVESCHDYATYYPHENGGLTSLSPYGESHVHRCNQRFCPVCALFESRKTMASVRKFVENIGGDFVLVTFTVRNVPLSDLRSTVQFLNSVYSDITHRGSRGHESKFGRAFDGTLRRIEVTYNPDSHTYHPHIHILCHCAKNYFKDPDLYFNQKDGKLELVHYFSDKAHLNYDASCDIRKVGKKYSVDKACAEISKYAFKIEDSYFLPENHAILDEYMRGILSLRRVTMIGAGGTLKGILYFVSKCTDDASVILGTKSGVSLNFVQYIWIPSRSSFKVIVSYAYNYHLDSPPSDDVFEYKQGMPDVWDMSCAVTRYRNMRHRS